MFVNQVTETSINIEKVHPQYVTRIDMGPLAPWRPGPLAPLMPGPLALWRPGPLA